MVSQDSNLEVVGDNHSNQLGFFVKSSIVDLRYVLHYNMVLTGYGIIGHLFPKDTIFHVDFALLL